MSSAATRPPTEKVVEYETYVDERIARVSFHIKLVDVAYGLLILVALLLGGLLALVLIDHWIVGLPPWARWLSLLALVGGSLAILLMRVFPPLVRAINPTYAAQTVERSFPGLKNSVINFLFFRQQPEAIHRSVFQGVRKQAAVGLSGVSVDAAVDRGPIIRIGNALAALVAIWCVYLLFAPKDPLQTIRRVAVPWEEIARPSQVRILAVNPGDTEVFQGQTLEVHAEVEGLKSDQLPSIEFSTTDLRISQRRIPLSVDSVPGRFVGVLTTGESGIQQDLEYWIAAGDALSRRYEVRTSQAPHIVVDRVRYEYPAYTGRAPELVQGEGDVKAIEGTRVTVHGLANQPIRSGHIELLRPVNEDNPEGKTNATSKTAPLKVDGSSAEVRLRLRLDGDRQRPFYRAYRLHFLNEQRIPSQDAVEHSIEVVPDLRPIVQILTPKKRTVELPANATQAIEVRALDPDFALTQVRLTARTRTRSLVDEELLRQPRGGQFVATYDFAPAEHGLRAGDVVELEATAEDNRHSPLRAEPEPNRSVSAKHFLRIVAPDPLAEDQENLTPEQPNEPETSGDVSQQKSGEQGNEAQPPGDDPDQQDPGPQDSGDAKSTPPPEDQQPQQPGGGDDSSGLQQDGPQGENARRQPLDSGQSGQSGSEQSEQSRDGPATGGDQAGPNQEGPNQEGTGAKPSEKPSESEQVGEPGQSPGDASQERPEGTRGAQPDEPLPSDGSRDGEVVERISEYLRQKGMEPSPESGSPPEQAPADADSPRDPATRDDAAAPSDSPTPESPAGAEQNGAGTTPETGTTPESSESTAGADDADAPPSPDATSEETPRGTEAGGDSNQGRDAGEQAEEQAGQGKQPGEQNRNDEESSDRQANPSEQARQAKGQTDEDRGGRSGDGADGTPQDGGAPQTGQKQPSSSETSSGTDPSDAGAEENESADPSGAETTANDAQPSDTDSKPTDDSASGPGTDSRPAGRGERQTANDATAADQTDSSNESTGRNGGEAGNRQSPRQPGDPTSNTGGQTAGRQQPGPGAEGTGEAGGDAANLQYAEQATELALDYLKDQQESPDRELLDELGWSPDDVRRFLDRWESMKRNAEGDDQTARQGRRELDEVLRSMGLRPPRNELRRSSANDDAQRGNRETGRRIKPPPDLAEPYRDFLKSLQR